MESFVPKQRNIEEDYDFVEVLYNCEWSAVIKAVSKKDSKLYAIKIFSSSGDRGEERAYMENEMVILSQINHPNIVNLYDVYYWKNREYLVLQYMSGGELFDRIIAKSTYTEGEAKRVLKPIVDAVRYLHDLQVVHRDLKPQNLLYDSPRNDAMIKLSDFGVSKIVSNLVMSTTVGTDGYLAPEILMGQGYDYKVDYWSLGIILYILLSGYPPFDQETQAALFDKIKRCDYSLEGETWSHISDNAKDLIKHLIIKDPRQRYDAEQIMNHPWMREDTNDEKILQRTVEKLKELIALRKMKRVSMAMKFIGRLQFLNLQKK